METADQEVLRTACDWLDRGDAVYLVTVGRTFGSSPRPAGSLLALRSDGRCAGSVSGDCLENDLAARVRRGDLPEKLPGVITYGVTADDARRFGLPCGGRMELVIEQLASAAPLRRILAAIDARECLVRRVCLATGEVSLHPATGREECSYDGATLSKVLGPKWRLLLTGAGQLSRFVAQMGLALEYDVVVCDPRPGMADAWPLETARMDTRMPDEVVSEFAHERCAVLTLMHDPKLDDLALLEAFETQAFYIGALGSRATSEKRRRRLAGFGIPPAQLARLHGPVGLPIGSRTPAEIAVAVLAGVTAARHGVRLGQPGDEAGREVRA